MPTVSNQNTKNRSTLLELGAGFLDLGFGSERVQRISPGGGGGRALVGIVLLFRLEGLIDGGGGTD